MAIGWIAEETGAEVIAVAVDVGQGGEDLDVIRQRALACGAVEAEVADARDEFADEYCLPALKANALYMDRYPLVSALSRPVIVKHLVAAARKHGATIVAHGCTGKGNDQVRFEVGIGALAPDLTLHRAGPRLALTRDKAIDFAEQHALPIDVDQEVAVLDRPERLGPRGRDRLPRGHLERADRGRLRLHRRTRRSRARPTRSSSPSTAGVPVAIDGQPGHDARGHRRAQRPRRRAGRRPHRHGRGPARRHQEPRGLRGAGRDRADRRAPELENVTVERDLARFKRQVEQRWGELVYDGLWFCRSSGRSTRFVDEVNEHVTGDVRLTLHGGRAVVTGRRSDAVALRLRPRHLRRGRQLRPVAGQGLRRALGPARRRSRPSATSARSTGG